ncbi:hypothetical protein niasHT_039795 [Heterodera trifolii]|uniref:Uncharacterized protein n=1 Tax=Heterodera trifolii TaxID=157864 RepID=A0ABD2J539_9BILA
MENEMAAASSSAANAINTNDQLKSNETKGNESQTKRNVMAPLALTGGTPSGGGGKCACISRLLQQICALIKHRPNGLDDDLPSVSVVGSFEQRWSTLFREFVLDPANCSWEKCVAHSDDMLWYVPIVRMANGGACAVGSEISHLQVFRRQSKNKPMPGDQNVNWQETVCLNLILQQLDYFVTVAVCTKNSPTNLQIHRKTCQRVYPSPSRRRMDAKGECEEVTYPKIFFPIDSFDEVFTDMVVSEGECVCVELVVRDRYRNAEAVIFLGSIRFDVLKKLYDSRQTSGAWNWAQRFIGSSMTPKRLEFVKMRGPRGRGFAEMAVTRVASCGFETPMSENGLEMNVAGRFDFNLSRRVSDVGAASFGGGRLFSRFLNGGARHLRGAATPGGLPPSVTPTTFYSGQRTATRWFSGESTDGSEMAEGASATDVQSLAGGLRTPGNWSMRGIGKALQLLRDRREDGAEEEGGEQLNALLTYITLPWTSILEDLLAPNSRKPILTFELQLIQNR